MVSRLGLALRLSLGRGPTGGPTGSVPVRVRPCALGPTPSACSGAERTSAAAAAAVSSARYICVSDGPSAALRARGDGQPALSARPRIIRTSQLWTSPPPPAPEPAPAPPPAPAPAPVPAPAPAPAPAPRSEPRLMLSSCATSCIASAEVTWWPARSSRLPRCGCCCCRRGGGGCSCCCCCGGGCSCCCSQRKLNRPRAKVLPPRQPGLARVFWLGSDARHRAAAPRGGGLKEHRGAWRRASILVAGVG